MSMHSQIESKIRAQFEPEHLDILNESNRHSGPGTDTHFKLTVVSSAFDGASRIQRHRQVNAALTTELQTGVHALSLKLYTPQEWAARGEQVPASPPCQGGSKSV